MKPEAIRQARNLLYVQDFGILGTISVKLEGFPFGSVVPYCLDGNGRPVVLISTIAQHTKNIGQDSRCSLTITAGGEDVQAHARLCLIGNMKKLPVGTEDSEKLAETVELAESAESAETVELAESAESGQTVGSMGSPAMTHPAATRERYYRYFPESRKYNQAHDFSFYYLDPVSVRYIGGFGAIYWVEPEQFFPTNPFFGKSEQRMLEHMNADHHDSLVRYLAHYKDIKVSKEADVKMVGINEQGFDVLVGKRKVWFEFEQPVENAQEAREALVKMAREARH